MDKNKFLFPVKLIKYENNFTVLPGGHSVTLDLIGNDASAKISVVGEMAVKIHEEGMRYFSGDKKGLPLCGLGFFFGLEDAGLPVKTDATEAVGRLADAWGRWAGVIRDSLTLEKIKRYPTLKRHLAGKDVIIWSGEHRAFWRPNGAGYTTVLEMAGIYKFEDAFSRSRGCDKSKAITYMTAHSKIDAVRETFPNTLGDWVKNY